MLRGPNTRDKPAVQLCQKEYLSDECIAICFYYLFAYLLILVHSVVRQSDPLNLVVSIPLCVYTILLECAVYTQQTVISCSLLQLIN